MISFIANLLKTVIFSFLLNDYLKRTYPKQYEDHLVTTSFNLVYAFSVIQIKLKQAQKYIYKTNPRIVELIETYNRNHIKNNIDYVLDGKIIYSSFYDSNSNCKKDDHPEIYDFIISSHYTSENNCVYKKIISKLDQESDTNEYDEYDEYDESDIKFILIELKNGDTTYKIELKTDSYNFYVVGNRFTKQFFIYYIKEIIKSTDPFDKDDKFVIKIIDNDVEEFEIEFIDANESLILDKNDYKIFSFVHTEDSNENKIEEEEKEEKE